MGTSIRVHVYQGDRIELLPAMCLFCGHPLGEEQFQHVDVQIGPSVRKLAFPICLVDKLPDQVLKPDGQSAPVAGVNPQRYLPYLEAAFTFQDGNIRFAQELQRLRNLPHDQYDPQMAQSNEVLLGLLKGTPTAEGIEAEEHRKQVEQQEAEDEEAFQLVQAARTGDVSAAESKASSRKLIWISLIAGAVGLLLVMCIAVGIGVYAFWKDKAAPDPDQKKALAAPKEIKAKIKAIDPDEKKIRFLLVTSKTETYRIDDQTEFFDREGQRLPQGLSSPQLKAEEYCVILPTENRQALQWLKLTPAPK